MSWHFFSCTPKHLRKNFVSFSLYWQSTKIISCHCLCAFNFLLFVWQLIKKVYCSRKKERGSSPPHSSGGSWHVFLLKHKCTVKPCIQNINKLCRFWSRTGPFFAVGTYWNMPLMTICMCPCHRVIPTELRALLRGILVTVSPRQHE